jgi:hypothetical protein
MDTEAELTNLDVRTGSVLVLRGNPSGLRDLADRIRGALYARNIDDVTIFVLAAEASLEVLGDADMLAAGWVRATPATDE